ncbi:MAG: C40 family peptidase [Actinobacteria bacterium]|nr:C40 family peptidase [Actinomycetota bacterium]
MNRHEVITAASRRPSRARAGLAALGAGAVLGSALAVSPVNPAPAEAAASTVRVKTKSTEAKLRAKVVAKARSKVGNQYVSGGTGPSRFDCSGLVYFTYKQVTGKTIARTASAQHRSTKRVAGKKHLQQGDLIFFLGDGHVGIYIGNGRFVHASNPRTDVRIDSIRSGYWAHHINGYGRVLVR